MLPGFIESLIKRWSSPRTCPSKGDEPSETGAPTNAASQAFDAALISRVTTFWHDAVSFVPLDDLIKEHPDAPELTFDQAATGAISKPAAVQQEPDEATEDDGREVTVALGLAPRDWHRLRGQSTRARYLLAIPARLNAAGHLLPRGTEMPFFNPARIQSNDQRNDIFITTTEIVNGWMDAHSLPPIQEWSPLWSYALEMLTGALLEPAADIRAAQETLTRTLGLTVQHEWIVKVVPGSSINKAMEEIEGLYRSLLDHNEQTGSDTQTFQRLISGIAGSRALLAEEAARADEGVFGHMDAFKATPEHASPLQQTREIFPLDSSQRQVVRHACRLDEGAIQAVNGPPGTGKTATLRAVIASYWVRAALTQDRPPIIVGCGATNQAVINITEAFVDAPHRSDDYPLAERWNPFVSSYGMFFASDSFANDNPDKIRKYQGFQKSTRIKDRCLFTLREARNPFSPAEFGDLTGYYLRKATACSDIQGDDVASVVAALRMLLHGVAIDLPRTLRNLTNHAIGGTGCDLLADQRIQSQLMPLITRQNDFVQRSLFPTFADYLRAPSQDHLRHIMADAECDVAEAARLLMESVIDATLRPHAFHIAARYWEGRFLQAAAVRLYTRSEENLKDALQRICMLAPCIVSTINNLPRLFAISHPDPDAPRHFAYGAADLLIMDESGQALPEAGAACFALTKRALVVGDLKQLEPVATIQPQNEIAILTRRNAVDDYIYLTDTSKAPSSGSVLAMAQRASSYHDLFGNGLTLLFHYRCIKPIIDYCNRLSYGGHLKAKTGSGAGQWPPPLAWVEVVDTAARRGGSWVNEREAREIASWLRSAWPRIHESTGGKATIAETVAVLSAFRPQIDALRKAIAEAFATLPAEAPPGAVWPTQGDIRDMTIGTVHALQGAERPIVLFSGTVSAENTAIPFFDSSPNILNVAVSRAKKSFLYFGDPKHLFRHDRDGALTSGKPSAILGDHMRRHPLAKRLYPLYLVIVEAPGKSRVIGELLGKDYRIFATNGSIREIDESDLGLGLDRGLRPRWRWREGSGKPSHDDFAALARDIDNYEAVYIATDADMEGEAIAWHVTDVLASIAGARVWDMVRRVRLGDITREALQEAFASPGAIDRNIAAAAIARAIADRLIAGRLAAEVNRVGTAAEMEREAALSATFLPVTGLGRRSRTPRHHPGRVQAGILRLVFDAAQRDIEDITQLGRFRINAAVTLGEHRLKGRLVLPDREYRLEAGDEDAARQKLRATVSARLPTTLEGYEHDGLEHAAHALGSPPFLSTIEVMRRAARHGLMPWQVMEALQNLYLGQIMTHEYLGEIEE
jgi:hypothetical protein